MLSRLFFFLIFIPFAVLQWNFNVNDLFTPQRGQDVHSVYRRFQSYMTYPQYYLQNPQTPEGI